MGTPHAVRLRRLRTAVALSAMVASAGCLVASTLTWLSVPDGAGGRTTLTGWGGVSGGQISGQNVNDALAGFASFRPGGLAVVVGGLALLAAFGILLVARGQRPHRVPAAVLTLSGAVGLGWGLLRGTSPGDLNGTYADVRSQISSGAGPWLTAGCSVLLLAAAVVVFTGLLDPPQPLRHRGIGPR